MLSGRVSAVGQFSQESDIDTASLQMSSFVKCKTDGCTISAAMQMGFELVHVGL